MRLCARTVEGSLGASKQADGIHGARWLARVGHGFVAVGVAVGVANRFIASADLSNGLLNQRWGRLASSLLGQAASPTRRARGAAHLCRNVRLAGQG